MIGDWVYMEAHKGYEAQYIQVETILDANSKDHHGHIGAFPVGGDNDFRDIEDRHLFPIPLTPEILEKSGFGFIKSDNTESVWNGWWIYEGLELATACLDREGNWPCFINIYDSNIKCEYVHQLQHALHLCKIKHEITL